MNRTLARINQPAFAELCQDVMKALDPDTDFRRKSLKDRSDIYVFNGPSRLKRDSSWSGVHALASHASEVSSSSEFESFVAKELNLWTLGRQEPDASTVDSPNYLIFCTNLELDPSWRARIEQLIRRARSLSDFLILDEKDLLRVIAQDKRLEVTYNGLTAHGDVMADVSSLESTIPESFGGLLLAEMRASFQQELFVRLSQSGGDATDRPRLDQIAIDLPLAHGSTKAVAEIVQFGDNVLRAHTGRIFRSNFLLIGGPGQGKTTVTQMIAQTYRMSLLGSTYNPPQVTEFVESLHSAFGAQEIPSPRNRRWPLRMDLAKFAERITDDDSLLSHMVDFLAKRTGLRVRTSELEQWLRVWPSVLIFDGLDEIASDVVRMQLVDMIYRFQAIFDGLDADILIVVSSRPQVLSAGGLGPQFEDLRLRALNITEATDYGRQLIELRHSKDPEVLVEVTQRLARAAGQPNTARLLTTPLQVTIICLLLERPAQPPQTRHALFESYFETIYTREAGKPGPLAAILDEYKSVVTTLHERVGLELQISEASGIDRWPLDSLGALAVNLLGPNGEGFAQNNAERLGKQIVKAATERLVLLTPVGVDSVGFEVRSLQEYMAARAITTGSDDLVLTNLLRVISLLNWRNVWLLAAGRVFTHRPHIRQRVIADLRSTDSERFFSIDGPLLALEMLQDGIALRAPIFQQQILSLALELLERPPTGYEEDLSAVSISLYSDPVSKAALIAALQKGLRSAADRDATTRLVLRKLVTEVGPLPAKARQLLSQYRVTDHQALALERWIAPGDVGGSQTRRLGSLLKGALESIGVFRAGARPFLAWIGELNQIVLAAYPAPDYTYYAVKELPSSMPRVDVNVLQSPDLMATLTIALYEIDPEAWAVTALLLRSLRVSAIGSPPEFESESFIQQ